ncbi:MAG: AAA family ATPase [Candidatus Hydrogenedentes bacterium]|nr:AAA family ATPase [Candidatus Hydrogenedentota bacterium]
MNDTPLHLDYFRMRKQPFAPTADPAYFYATQDHKSCLFRLWTGIDERYGIAVVLGSYGTGKTTLLRKLMSGMAAEPERYNTAVLASPIPSWTSFSLLEAITKQFGLMPLERSFGAHMEALNQYLLANRHSISTLIIDDAQNLNKRGQLELLRLAQNLETPQHKLLNLVFFAQLEWMEVLRAAPNFHQRINLTYTLSPISVEDIHELIQYRLEQAGAMEPSAPRFSDTSVEMIHAFSEGNPRVIVTLCRNSLVLAAQIKTTRITQDIILHTIEKTTVSNEETMERVRAKMRPETTAMPQAMVVGGQSPIAPAFAPGKARAYTARANRLLLQAARTRQR